MARRNLVGNECDENLQPSAQVPRRLVCVLLLVGCLGETMAAIPERAQQDPRYALGYVVVTHYPGVSSDGTGD